MGSERGEQPLSRCGERGVQRERGGSRNTPLTLWPSGATPAAMHLAKGIRPAPRDHPLCGKPPSDAASLPRFPTLRIFFFCNFLRDFRLIFRWKAVVDSVQFRVILNITTKRFDAASWHAEMLRFGRRPTAANATARNAPSRENAFGALRRACNGDDRRLWRKQGGAVGAAASRMQGPLKGRGRRWEPQPVQTRIKNNSSAAIARAKRRQFQIVHPTNERSLTYLESTTP